MTAELLINAGIGETRIALRRDGGLTDLILERGFDRGAGQVGDIICGRVQKVVAAMQAAFVEIGHSRPGFLALDDAMVLSRDEGHDISACLREGEAVLVQVIKDPIGEKGARLSADISLPGQWLVLTPSRPEISLSRRIENEAARKRLRTIGEGLQAAMPNMGWIFRTQAAEASDEDLQTEAQALRDIWSRIEADGRRARPPATLHRELGAIERSLRDLARDVAQIRIDDAAALEAARGFCARVLPEAQAKLSFALPPLFDEALEDEIAALSLSRVSLPSGGWLTIESTEALTAIDINSGAFTQSSNLAETARTTNREAASEIGRQLHLRGIGGLIVVDFIQLRQQDDHRAVLAALTQSVNASGVPARISPMAEFGIVAIARKRQRESLSRLTTESCPDCEGGRRPSAQTQALAMLRRLEREARANPARGLRLRAPPRVLEWLRAHEDDVRAGLHRRGVARVSFEEGKEAIDAV